MWSEEGGKKSPVRICGVTDCACVKPACGDQKRSGQRCYCSAAQSCPTLCDPMNCSMPASLSFSVSQRLLRFMYVESVMPSNHLILCLPLLLLPSIFPSIRVFSSESVLRIRWPKYCSFSFSISPSSVYSGLISGQ